MKSFLSDAISRAGTQSGDVGPTYQEYSAADQELLRVLESLKTNIKIVGCGGGGSNTIDRLSEVGIAGADIYAANTDAQHLL
ncbi:MAG TPA: cell division protein FtsZ, partial [Methanomassiliicoccaceae archaeon]|nr:cell division protein FtsZ [Methanomassiliicoccaceae archaeon]